MKSSKTLKTLVTLVAATCVLGACRAPRPEIDADTKLEQLNEFDHNSLGAEEQKTVDACSRRIEKNPKDVSAYMERAATYGCSLAFCQKAIADYTTVIKLDPRNAEAYDSRGKAYAWLNLNREAIPDFSKAIELVLAARTKKDRADDDVVDLALCFTDRGDAFFQQRQFQNAIHDYKAARLITPIEETLFLKLGDCYRVLRQHAQAIENYTNAIKWDKQTWEVAAASRAHEYRASRQYDKARADYTRIITAGKGDANTYLFRAEIYKLMGRSDRAQRDIEHAEALEPKQAPNETTNQAVEEAAKRQQNKQSIEEDTKAIDAGTANGASGFWLAKRFQSRASLFYAAGETQKAINDYTKAIELAADESRYNNRAVCYLETKQFQKAVDDYTSIITMQPGDALTYQFRGQAYAKWGNYSKAIEDYSRAIELNPSNGDFYKLRGDSHAAAGEKSLANADYEKAVELYTESIDTNTDYLLPYVERARAYFALGKFNEALADYNDGIRNFSEAPMYYRDRAELFYTLKRYNDAIADYKHSIALYADNAAAYEGLAKAYEAIGDSVRSAEAKKEAERKHFSPPLSVSVDVR